MDGGRPPLRADTPEKRRASQRAACADRRMASPTICADSASSVAATTPPAAGQCVEFPRADWSRAGERRWRPRATSGRSGGAAGAGGRRLAWRVEHPRAGRSRAEERRWWPRATSGGRAAPPSLEGGGGWRVALSPPSCGPIEGRGRRWRPRATLGRSGSAASAGGRRLVWRVELWHACRSWAGRQRWRPRATSGGSGDAVSDGGRLLAWRGALPHSVRSWAGRRRWLPSRAATSEKRCASQPAASAVRLIVSPTNCADSARSVAATPPPAAGAVR